MRILVTGQGTLPGFEELDALGGALSDRELTVLRYLASRLTNREIAACSSPSTTRVWPAL